MKRLGGTFGGALANLAAQGIPFLLVLIVTPILLRALGREQYGALILFNLVPLIAGQLDLGLATAAMRGFTQYSARADHSGARRLFREAFVFMTAWGLLLGIALYLLHAPLADVLKLDTVVDDRSAIWWVSALAIPLALANSATLVPLRALELYGRAARIQVIVYTCYWVACAEWASRGATLLQLVSLGTAAIAVATVAQFAASRDRPKRESIVVRDTTMSLSTIGPLDVPVLVGDTPTEEPIAVANPSGLLLRPFLPLGAGAFVAQASSLATYHADKLLVSALVSPAAAGAYAICTSIANKILLVVAAGATFTFPRSARLHTEGDATGIATTYARATRLSLLIAALLAVTLIAIAPAFLAVWLGANFARDYGLTLRLLALGYAIAASSVVASNVAVGIGEVFTPAVFAMLGGAITLAAVALLAPRYGASGAAAAALIGMTQALIFNDTLAKRLGPAAREASWPLVWRIALIGIPVAIAAGMSATFVAGWISLTLLGAATAGILALFWLWTFGRVIERALLDRLLLRIRHV